MTVKPTALGAVRGAALYVGAIIGPGVLLIPSLAARAAGPASVLAWAALLALSIPLAATFSTLGVRHPVPGGVTAYVREAFGEDAAAVTGAWFTTAVIFGAPAVSLIGGYYVADLTGSGTTLAVTVAIAILTVVLVANLFGLRISSGFQMALSAVLVSMIAVAVCVALPTNATRHWVPFAPRGWWSVGTAANILIWLFVGWEAMAQMAGEFRDPDRDLPRAVGLAFGVMTLLYVGLAVATITIPATSASKVPLADLLGAGFGRAGRDAAVLLAVALTMGTMNVYVGSAAKLAANLAREQALPAWLGAGKPRDIPRRPLMVLAVTGATLLIALAAGATTPTDLVRATSACFIAVYVIALASAVRVLVGRSRLAAVIAVGPMVVVAMFSSEFLVVPVAAALACLGLRRAAGT